MCFWEISNKISVKVQLRILVTRSKVSNKKKKFYEIIYEGSSVWNRRSKRTLMNEVEFNLIKFIIHVAIIKICAVLDSFA